MDRKLTILYGSHTGTAQDLAEHIWRESKKYHFGGTVTSMDKYDVQSLIGEKFAIFVCSTTGLGDEPDNMKSFWKFLLRKSLPANSLSGLYFAVLGLGDSSYAKFNFVAKRLNKRLQQLGATAIVPAGLCDDQHDLGPSAVYVPWLNNVWDKLLQYAPFPNGLTKLDESPRQFRWNIEVNGSTGLLDSVLSTNIYENYKDAVFDDFAFNTSVIGNQRITAAEHFQDVRLIGFGCENIKWEPGDVLVVRPANSDEQVDELFAIFAEHSFPFNADTIVKIKEIDAEMPVPSFLEKPLSLKTIAKQLWDLNAIPRPRTFELLALNCKDELEKEKLLEFASAEGQNDLFAYANRPRRNLLEVLRDFHKSTSQLNLQILFEIFQFIKTRSFSIASCHESGRLELLVAVVEYKTMMAKVRRGLCSNWLKSLKKGDQIRAVIKKGTFKLSMDETTPIVMVGPGTGLAPFRSLLQKKRFNFNGQIEVEKQFLNILFFGCRGEKLDFYCRDELEEMEKMRILKLFTAFSRDQEDKIYVQHRIEEQSSLLRAQLINKNGIFLVGGNSKNMPAAVKEALGKALGDPKYVENMIESGRYQEETWA